MGIPTASIKVGLMKTVIQVLGEIRNVYANEEHFVMVQQLQLNLGKWERFYTNKGEIKNI